VRQRSRSAIGVALVGLLPAILGGPVWAVVLTILCLIGFQEFLALARTQSPGVSFIGFAIVPLFAVATIWERTGWALLAVVSLALLGPLAATTIRGSLDGAVTDSALTTMGILYLGLPLFAAIELRDLAGAVNRSWLESLADTASIGWGGAPRGLAWLVTVILVTWMADTFAYIVGRQFGRHKLSPVVSPNKSVEGLVGGIAAAAITGALSMIAFGLDQPVWIGLLLGIVLALTGLAGDLSESVLKREAGVKDSGNLIPGHGGMLDRLDAFLFNFVVGLFLALAIDRFA
jgi:phosphatidate cytidylyltransferase